MTQFWFFLLTIIGGAIWGAQASINSALGKKIGTLEGAFVNFAVGTLILAIIVLFFGKGNILQVVTVPKWQLVGGFMGAAVIFTTIISVPRIGAASMLLAMISGQIVISMIIDHFGFFGVPRIAFDWQRLLALLLMSGSLFLIFRSSV